MTTDPIASTELDDDDFRAMNAALGSQVMILRFPPKLESPWYSSDDLASITVVDGTIEIRTVGQLSARTTLQLAAAAAGFSAQLLAGGRT